MDKILFDSKRELPKIRKATFGRFHSREYGIFGVYIGVPMLGKLPSMVYYHDSQGLGIWRTAGGCPSTVCRVRVHDW